MGVLLFLLIPAVAVAVGWAVLAVRQHKPSGMHHSIDSFRREMDALSPDRDQQRRIR
ncbi:MAG: hypothetical protein ACR2LQ_12405 [Acidimicrobiales bacterium]